MQETRTEPRQRRSQQSIDSILDAAEQLIHERGQVDFTAKELSEAAAMSIGRIYYWFPDIQAVVDALVLRSAQNLLALDKASPGDGTVFTIRTTIESVAAFIDQNPAAVALCLTGGEQRAGQMLYDGLVSSIARRLAERVPNITFPEIEVVSRTIVGIILGMLSAYASGGERRPHILQELIYVLSAYLYSRFPPPGDDAWTSDHRPVQPARPSKVGSFEQGVAWPAFAPDQH